MNGTIRTTAILGFGRFGRALSDLLLDAGHRVRALDPNASIPGSMRVDSLADLVRAADTIVLAIPVAAVGAAARALKPLLDPGQLVVDVASVKHGAVRDLTAVLGGDFPWVATHPLFGPTSIGLGERPLVAVVCPNPLHPSAAPRARTFFSSIGCEVVEQDAVGHDQAMAATHALAFFVAKGLIDVGAGEQAPFVPPSFRAMAGMIDAVRSDASHLFATIQSDNPFAAEARARLLNALIAIDRDLVNAPHDSALKSPRLAIAPLPPSPPESGEAPDPIEDIDRDLVHLLGRRAQCVRRADRVHASEGEAHSDPSHERRMKEARSRWAESEGLEAGRVAEIFESIDRVWPAGRLDPQ